ncbi:DUF6350 family protein [Micropruina sp.]|uniref:cell division protein PerM n=1 Tax=Micropruina sp. TaxID=2737536 RepID=UPI0039E682C7
MPVPSDRRRSRLQLTVAAVNPGAEAIPVLEFPLLPTALAAGAAAAVVGWLLVIGLVMVGWFTAMAIPVPRMLGFAGQLWLAGHGAGATIGEVTVTLAPLGLSLLFVLLTRTVVGLVLRVVPGAALDGLGALKAWALVTAGYGAVGGVVALSSGAAPRAGWALLGGLVVGALGSGWVLAPRLRRLAPAPVWLAGLPRAVVTGLATMTAVAAAVLLVGLIVGSERVSLIENSLATDAVGNWLLVIAQLLYLPNLLAWSASWVLGAGFSVGVGSFVSPLLSTVGLLPAVPVFGAVPQPGGGSAWSYAWLVSGLVAGAAAGWTASARPAVGGSWLRALARGAGSGFGVAVLIVVVGVLSRGDLGNGRLVGMGPVLLNLIWLAPLPLAFGGASGALGHWFAKARHLPEVPRPGGPDDTTELLDMPTERLEQQTVPLARRD